MISRLGGRRLTHRTGAVQGTGRRAAVRARARHASDRGGLTLVLLDAGARRELPLGQAAPLAEVGELGGERVPVTDRAK